MKNHKNFFFIKHEIEKIRNNILKMFDLFEKLNIFLIYVTRIVEKICNNVLKIFDLFKKSKIFFILLIITTLLKYQRQMLFDKNDNIECIQLIQNGECNTNRLKNSE